MLTKADQFAEPLALLAEQAKALSHPARLSILQILAERNSCICGELVEDLPLAQATVSRHLKALKESGLIKGEVDGPRSCYCIDREALASLQQRLNELFEGVLRESSDLECC